MEISPRHLRYIASVARHGSITAAASELGVSQPSISVAIQRVLAGRPLFVRRPGAGVSVTPFGRSFLNQARQVLRESDALNTLLRHQEGLDGELVVDCFEDLAPYCLAPIIADLARRQPGLRLIATEFDFATLAERMATGVSDVSISYDLAIPGGLHVERIRAQEAYALIPGGDPLGREPTVSLRELVDRTLILSSRRDSAEHFLNLFRIHGHPLPAYRTFGSFELQRSMIANGLGCGIGYTRPVGDTSYDGKPILCLPIRDALPEQHVVVVLRRQPAPGSAEACFVESARAFFEGPHAP